jgi:hypothetical protein
MKVIAAVAIAAAVGGLVGGAAPPQLVAKIQTGAGPCGAI